MAQSNTASYHSIPPILLPQKRALFEKIPSNDPERLLPTDYKNVAKVLNTADSYKVDLRAVLKPDRSKPTMQLYELALLVFNNNTHIDYLLRKFYILENCSFLDKWVAKVLIAEMLWGKQQILSNSDEAEAIRYYEEELRESFVEVMDIFRSPLNLHISNTLPVYVRINLLSISIEKAIRAFNFEGWNLLPSCETYLDYLQKLGYLSEGNFMRDFHVPEVLVFPAGTSFYNHCGYFGGKFILQDKGSCLASALLNPAPGSTVLDLFAAPGLKTNHIANIMNNNGLIYANDIHPQRFTTMSKVLELTNAKCVKLLQGHYTDIKDCNATHIIVDPTCSYSGIFSNKEKSYQRDRIKKYKASLTEALRHVLKNFHSAKRVVFTTCSIFPEEGEQIVDEILKEFEQSFILLDLKEILWNAWMNVGSTDYLCGSKCLRTVPEFDLCQGCFIALFERQYTPTPTPYYLDPPVKEKCSMRIAANEEIVYESDETESTTQCPVQHNANNVYSHRHEAAVEQEYQYMYIGSSSDTTYPTGQY